MEGIGQTILTYIHRSFIYKKIICILKYLIKYKARKFLENKKILKYRYEEEKSGDIQIYKDQAKILGQLTKSQQETSKATQDKIVVCQDLTNNALVPFTTF